MQAAKTVRWSKSAICLGAVFIFFLQITLMPLLPDAGAWTVKLRRMLTLSQWDASDSDGISCDRSHVDFDLCMVSSPTLLDQASLTFFTLGPHNRAQSHFPVKIQPYPRKNDKSAMSYVKEITLTSAPPKSTCHVTHRSPALVFSAGGYVGNFYHEMDENFIPLFITVHSLFPNQDFVLVITDVTTWWFQKYAQLLLAYSPHIINTNNLTATHCFPSTIVGLIKHGPMIIDPTLLPYPKTLFDFYAFLKEAYMKNDSDTAYDPILTVDPRPRLIFVNRNGNVSREVLNQEEMIKAAREIGFNVHVFEPSRNTSMVNAYKLIHTSHVMLGVHGAGLTHSLFLRPGSVLVQVVPIGTEWVSRTYFEKPARILGVEYLEYKINVNESSMVEAYGANSFMVKDPRAYVKKNLAHLRIYLKRQNVRLDMNRFRKCLMKAYKKAKLFMEIERES